MEEREQEGRTQMAEAEPIIVKNEVTDVGLE